MEKTLSVLLSGFDVLSCKLNPDSYW